MMLTAGQRVTFNAYADVRDYTVHEAAGDTTTVLSGRIRDALNVPTLGHDTVVTGCDGPRNHLVDDVLCAVVQWTPANNTDTTTLGGAIMNALHTGPQNYAERDAFTPHRPITRALTLGALDDLVVDDDSVRP